MVFGLAFLILPPSNCLSQIVLFESNFGSYPDGTTGGVGWFIDATDCDDASPNEGLGISAFGVYGGVFTANDSEGSPCCQNGGGGYANYIYTTPIDIHPYCQVFVSFSLLFGEGVECADGQQLPLWGCTGNTPPDNYHDQFALEYEIDGGGYQLFTAWCGTVGGGVIFNQFPIVFGSASTITFRASLANNADDEYLYLDYLNITTDTNKIIPVFNPIGPYCENEPPILLPPLSANGILGTWDVGAYFDPSGLGGTTTPITFTPVPEALCTDIVTLDVVVFPAPQPILDPIGPFCTNESAIALQNEPNGVPGNWSGPGVSLNFFNPTAAGVGQHTLTYTPSIPCSEPQSIEVEVGQPGTPTLLGATACATDQPINLTTLQDPLFPVGTWTGPNVNGDYFDPANAAGAVELTFTPLGVCSSNATTTINVNTPNEITLGTTQLCNNEANFDLLQLSDPDFPSGTWSGTGVNGNSFNPSGLNGNINLTFNPSQQCVNTGTTFIYVTPPVTPQLTSTDLCSEDPPFNLSQLADPNFPSGLWSGPGVTGEVFDPSSINGNVELTFQAYDACTDLGTTNITVTEAQLPQLGTTTTCETSGIINLNSLADPAFPNGTWSGPGVSGNSFNPSGLSGPVNLTFSPSANCAATATTTLTVTPAGTPQLGTASLCQGDNPLNLTSLADPVFPNGTWSGPGVSGNSFNPSSFSGPVSLTFSPSANCAATTTTTLTVNSIPDFSIQNLEDCDANAQSYTVSLSISGGTQPYFVGSNLLSGTSFTSPPIPSGNSYAFQVTDAFGCGMEAVNGLVNCNCPTSNSTMNQTLCAGESFILNGNVFNEANPSGSVVLPGANFNGCDSVVFVNLSFTQAVQGSLVQTLCPGESLSVGGNLFNESNPTGLVNFPNGSYLGCDSVVNVALGFYQNSIGQISQTLCTGGSLNIGGTVFDAANPSGMVSLANAGANGCDSIVQVSLNFNSVVTSSLAQTLCPGENLSVGGTVFNESNPTGSVNFPKGSYLGCDSVVNVALGFYPASIRQFSVSH